MKKYLPLALLIFGTVCFSIVNPENELKTYSNVIVLSRDTQPLLSYLVQNNSQYKQVFNPTWIEPTANTNQRKGLLVRTQDCAYNDNNTCVFCGGAANKASIMTFSE